MGVHIVRGSTGALTDESAVWRDSAFNPPSLSGRTMVTDVPSIPRDWADDLSSMHGSQILGISGAPPRTPTPPPLSPGLLKDLYTGTSPTHVAPSALAKPEIIYIASPAQPMTQLAPELSHGNRVSHSSPLSIVATYPESQRDRRSTMSTVIPLTTPDAEPGSWNPFRNSVRSLLTQASGETEGSRYSYHSALPSSTLSGGNMYFQNVPPVPAIPEQYVSSIQASHGHGQEEERRVNRRGMVATPKPGPKLNMTSVKLGRGGYHSSMTPSPGDNIDMFLDLQPPNARLGDVDTERQHLRGLPAHEVYRNSGTG